MQDYFLVVGSFQLISAQKSDSLHFQDNADSAMVLKSLPEDKTHQFSYKKLIVPTVLISYGIASLSIDELKTLNSSTQYEIKRT